MQELYATLLLHEAKLPINEENLTKVLQSVGVVPDQARLKSIVASLEGQNIDELIKQATIVAPAGETTEKKEEKKPEEKKKSDEEASAGLSALFG